MDNLDRTNVVQSVLARRTLVRCLEMAGASSSACAEATKNCLETPFEEFERVRTCKDVRGDQH